MGIFFNLSMLALLMNFAWMKMFNRNFLSVYAEFYDSVGSVMASKSSRGYFLEDRVAG